MNKKRSKPIESFFSSNNESCKGDVFLDIVDDHKNPFDDHLGYLYETHPFVNKGSNEMIYLSSIAGENMAMIQNNGDIQMAVKTMNGDWILQKHYTVVTGLKANKTILKWTEENENGETIE